MKAFGARLAAGAAIIVLGAVMAAQAQKDHQDTSLSGWNSDAIAEGEPASPIGANTLLAADPWAAQGLASFDANSESDELQPPAVQLVQHTEPAGSMALPQISTRESSTAESVPGIPAMPMRMPRFEDASATDAERAASAPASIIPSVSVGFDSPSMPAEPPATSVEFSQSPVRAFEAAQDDRSVVHGQAPSNGLRGSLPPLRESSSGDMDSDSPAGFAAGLADLPSQIAPSVPAPAQPSFATNPAVTDSVDSGAGQPEAMLHAILPGQEAMPQNLAAAPKTTLRISREPAALLEPAAAPRQAATAPGVPTMQAQAMQAQAMQAQAMDAQTMSSAGQVGDQGYNQPVGGYGDQGYAQSAGGFGVPANYELPGRGQPQIASQPTGLPATQPGTQPAPTFMPNPLPAATLPVMGGNANTAAPNNFTANPNSFGVPAQIASAPAGQNSIYRGAGYRDNGNGNDRALPPALPSGPLPAGPTMASPGDRALDGPQSPSVVIQKVAPAEVKVGKPATFTINVRNVGGSKALDVIVRDQVPTGMQIVDATPRPNPKYQNEMVWTLGDMEPNQEHTITLQLTPLQEGTLGSVARVTFQAAASVRTVSTRPQLKIVQNARKQVLIGQQVEIDLEVSNPGTGVATGVVMQEDVPAGLKHPQGKELDNLIGNLGPGEIRRQVLRMQAVQAGVVQNTIRVKGDDGLESTHTVAIEIISPELQVALTGPSRRYLERQATFVLNIANVGTADATNVEISVQLDRGFTFVSTEFEGQYDPARHAVFWALPQLPVGEKGEVKLTLLPVEEGDRVLRSSATADLKVAANSESRVEVGSLAELTFSINDSADPVEVGGESIYEIRVNNSGSKDDTNIRVQMIFPPGIQLAQQQGDFTNLGQGAIEFTPRALLKANDEVVYRVKTIGSAPGRHKVKAIVTSDQSDVPVTKEESIMVYSDQ